jgi:hypothetical protein
MRPTMLPHRRRKYRSVRRQDPIAVAVPFRLRRIRHLHTAPDSSASAFSHVGPCSGSAGTGPLAACPSGTAGDVRSWRRDGEPNGFTRSAVSQRANAPSSSAVSSGSWRKKRSKISTTRSIGASGGGSAAGIRAAARPRVRRRRHAVCDICPNALVTSGPVHQNSPRNFARRSRARSTTSPSNRAVGDGEPALSATSGFAAKLVPESTIFRMRMNRRGWTARMRRHDGSDDVCWQS